MQTHTTKKKTRQRAPRVSSVNPTVIGFRLDTEESAMLGEQAKERGLSPHRFAHDLTVEALQSKRSADEALQAILQLQKQVLEMRQDIGLVAEALLTSAGVPREVATDWVDTNLKPSPD